MKDHIPGPKQERDKIEQVFSVECWFLAVLDKQVEQGGKSKIK